MEDDRELVRLCLGGRQEAFARLVDRYQKPLYNTALRMVKDRQDAEDILQTAFLKAYENLSTYDPSYRFFSWIYRLTVNEALNFLKRRKRLERFWSHDGIPEVRDGTDRDAVEAVEEGLGFLSPRDRAIVALKHIEGFSYDEISYILDIPPKRVKSRLYTARQRLRDVLVQQGLVQTNA